MCVYGYNSYIYIRDNSVRNILLRNYQGILGICILWYNGFHQPKRQRKKRGDIRVPYAQLLVTNFK